MSQKFQRFSDTESLIQPHINKNRFSPRPPPLSAPRPATTLLFRGVTNTSLEITWSGPVGSDYDDFDLQWTPRDRLSVINPYHSRTSGSRILRGMYPGRLYTFSLRTVSGAMEPGATPSYSAAIQNSIRTSRWQHFP